MNQRNPGQGKRAAERSTQAVGRLREAETKLDEALSRLGSAQASHDPGSDLRKEIGKFYRQDAKDRKRAGELLARLIAEHSAAKAQVKALDEQKDQIWEKYGNVAYRDLRSSPRLSAAERGVVESADEMETRVYDLAEQKRALSGAIKSAEKQEAMVREIEAAAKSGDEKTVVRLGNKLGSAMTLRRVLETIDPLDEGNLSFEATVGADMDVFSNYRELRKESAEGFESAQSLVARRRRAVRVHEREVSRLGRLERAARGLYVENSSGQGARHYVWVLAPRSDVPLPGEGPYGPHSLRIAEQMARIGATEGVHDRAVSLGRDPEAHGFRIERRYQARSGKRLA